MSGTVDLRLIFTGICTFVPRAPVAQNQYKEVRFIMPDARKWRKSQKKAGASIPPHRVFLIVKEADTAQDSTGGFLGREPSGRLGDKWVYWTLEHENLRVKDAPASGVEISTQMKIADIPKLCYDARIAPHHIDGDSTAVLARVILQNAALSQGSETACMYQFQLCDNTYTQPSALADEVVVDITRVPVGTSGEVQIISTSLNDQEANAPPIILRAAQSGTIQAYCANAPESDLLAVLGQAPPHAHGDANLHFELYYLLSQKAPTDIIPVPELVPGTCKGKGPPLPGTDSCPPSSNMP